MNDLAHAGVYIREVPSGPGPITGVSTSNFGLIGFSPKGPVNQPTICSNFQEYSTKFGSFTEKGLSGHEAYAFYANGGQILYFVRVVADDAEVALWDMDTSVESEAVSNVAEPTGVYELNLDKMPVKSGAKITFSTSTALEKYVFDVDADGVMTINATESGATAIAAGGSGSMNMATGEMHVELGNPAFFAGSSNWILADYDYTVFRFEMAWPGLAGNFFRVRMTVGSDDYLVQEEARWTRFNVIVEEDLNQDATNRAWSSVETWADLVFDDPTDPAYVATVINADNSGSDLIRVVDYGNSQNPLLLQGAQILDEDFSATQYEQGTTFSTEVPYDGLIKGWAYKLNDGPFLKTLNMKFQFSDASVEAKGNPTTADPTGALLTDSGAAFTPSALVGMVVVNMTNNSSGVITANDATTVTAQLAGGSAQAWLTSDDYAILDPKVKVGTGTGATGAGVEAVASPSGQIVPGSVVVKATMVTAAGVKTFTDDGLGNIKADPSATVPGATVATINYATGQITGLSLANQIDFVAGWTGDTVAAGSNILFGCIYAQEISIVDDADGNLAMADVQATGVPSKFFLNDAGINTIDYDTGDVAITWGIVGNPGAGPAGVYSEVADYYTNPEANYTNPPTPGIAYVLSGGTDGSDVSSAEVVSPELAVSQEGIYSFGKVDALMSLVAADFQTDTYVSAALIAYAELVKDKFVLITAPHGLSYQEVVNWKKFQLNRYTSYAALYYPHIKVKDPVSGVNLDIPCGGHVAGIYARTDSQYNVGEAPAGMEKGAIAWSVGLEAELTPTQVDVIYPEKINPLVSWSNTGTVVWGARTLDAAGGEWPYIQTRRLFMFVEKSVFNATHVHVFKNNGSSLWGKIQTQVATFLLGLFQSGYLAGNTPSDAFFVICDRSNNPQNTVDQGIIFCDVGIAGNTPGEFLVFRFQQKALAA